MCTLWRYAPNLYPYKIADLLRFKTFAINIKSNLYKRWQFMEGFHGPVSGQRVLRMSL